MKKIRLLSVLSLVLFLSACTDVQSSDLTESFEFGQVHYFRTYALAYHEDTSILKIHQLSELQEYMSLNVSNFQFGETALNYFQKNLDETFFEEYSLIVLVIEESSGSIRHNLKSIDVDNHTLNIHLERLTPEVGTTDMAIWHIVIEIKKTVYDFNDIELNIE